MPFNNMQTAEGRDDAAFSGSVCVHTEKIYDSCRDRDCLEDLRLYPTVTSLPVIAAATSVRPRSGELLYASVDVEEVSFNKGYYTVDIRYFYRIRGDAYSLLSRTTEFTGLAVSDKRVILYGGEGNAKIFSSNTILDGADTQRPRSANLPTAVVEAVDPIVLSMTLVENETPDEPVPQDAGDVPEFISDGFDGALATTLGGKSVFVTLGQFSIVRMERDSQLLIPVYDYCVPEKDCVGGDGGDPCALFSAIRFPIDEFFPSDGGNIPDTGGDALSDLTR